MTSRIGNHIYAKNATEAIKFYKKAFDLVEKGEPWFDDEGLIIHQDLWQKNGEHFLSVTEYTHLPNNIFVKKFNTDNCLTMLFFIFMSDENALQKAFDVLSEDVKLVREIEHEGADLVCEIVDKFGVFWHLRVPTDEKSLTSFFYTTL